MCKGCAKCTPQKCNYYSKLNPTCSRDVTYNSEQKKAMLCFVSIILCDSCIHVESCIERSNRKTCSFYRTKKCLQCVHGIIKETTEPGNIHECDTCAQIPDAVTPCPKFKSKQNEELCPARDECAFFNYSCKGNDWETHCNSFRSRKLCEYCKQKRINGRGILCCDIVADVKPLERCKQYEQEDKKEECFTPSDQMARGTAGNNAWEVKLSEEEKKTLNPSQGTQSAMKINMNDLAIDKGVVNGLEIDMTTNTMPSTIEVYALNATGDVKIKGNIYLDGKIITKQEKKDLNMEEIKKRIEAIKKQRKDFLESCNELYRDYVFRKDNECPMHDPTHTNWKVFTPTYLAYLVEKKLLTKKEKKDARYISYSKYGEWNRQGEHVILLSKKEWDEVEKILTIARDNLEKWNVYNEKKELCRLTDCYKDEGKKQRTDIALKICEECGKDNNIEAKFCCFCGKLFQE